MKLQQLKNRWTFLVFSGLFLCAFNIFACSNCHSTGQCMPGESYDSGNGCHHYYYACNTCYHQEGGGTADSNMKCVINRTPACANDDGGE